MHLGHRALYEKHLFFVIPSVNKSAFSNSTEKSSSFTFNPLSRKKTQKFWLNALRAMPHAIFMITNCFAQRILSELLSDLPLKPPINNLYQLFDITAKMTKWSRCLARIVQYMDSYKKFRFDAKWLTTVDLQINSNNVYTNIYIFPKYNLYSVVRFNMKTKSIYNQLVCYASRL